jgi:MFS family permease
MRIRKEMPAQGSTFSPLSHRLFLVLWITSLTGNLAHAGQSVAAQWLMTQIDGRADMVALIQTAINLPVMLLALVGGAVADVYDRRRVMLFAQGSLALVSGLLAFLVFRGMVTPWLLIALTFAMGVGVAFYNPAAQSSIGRVVPREELAGAVSLNILGFNVARTLGPAIGGGIVAIGGVFAGYVGSAVAFFAAAVLLMFWRPRFNNEGPKSGTHIFAAMADAGANRHSRPRFRLHALRGRRLGADAAGRARPDRRRPGAVRNAARRAGAGRGRRRRACPRGAAAL